MKLPQTFIMPVYKKLKWVSKSGEIKVKVIEGPLTAFKFKVLV